MISDARLLLTYCASMHPEHDKSFETEQHTNWTHNNPIQAAEYVCIRFVNMFIGCIHKGLAQAIYCSGIFHYLGSLVGLIFEQLLLFLSKAPIKVSTEFKRSSCFRGFRISATTFLFFSHWGGEIQAKPLDHLLIRSREILGGKLVVLDKLSKALVFPCQVCVLSC